MKNKKNVIVFGVLIVLCFVVGVSYAVWQLTLKQKDTNVLTSGCFKVTFEGKK